MNTQIDIAWLAGLLEGEGSFMMGRNTVSKKVYHYPRIVVTMTDEDVIQRAAAIFETSVYAVPNKRPEDRKPQWRAQVNGFRAAQFMELLAPHMGQRRRSKIEEILREYGPLETIEVRRKRACSAGAKERWDKFGTREGSLRG